MTFHDEIHAEAEQQALVATNRLLLWLQTIAPVESLQGMVLVEALLFLAKEMNWPQEVPDDTGVKLLKTGTNPTDSMFAFMSGLGMGYLTRLEALAREGVEKLKTVHDHMFENMKQGD